MALKKGIQKNRCVGAPSYVPLLWTYQEFVEQQEDHDPQVENGRIMESASVDGAEDRQKTGVFCWPLFCRYQNFSEEHQDLDPQVDNGHITGRAPVDGAEDRPKKGVFCSRLLCRYQDVVEQRQDTNPEVENSHISGSASLDGVEDRQKTNVLSMPFFCRPLGVVLKASTCAKNQGCFDHLTGQAFNKNGCVGAPAQCVKDASHKRCACE